MKRGSSAVDERVGAEAAADEEAAVAEEEEEEDEVVGGENEAGKTLEDLKRLFKGRG